MMRVLALIWAVVLAACGQTTTTEEPAYPVEAPAAWETDNVFARLDGGSGIYVEFPSHWYVLSREEAANVSAAGAALAASSGVTAPGRQTVLAVNATPSPTGAMIRLSTVSPATVPQNQFEQILREGTQEDLIEVTGREFAAMFPPMMSRANIDITNIAKPRILNVAGYPAILIAYTRSSAVSEELWEVRMYQIARGDQTIELTLSNRLSDRAIWTPIMDRTLETLTIPR